MSSNTLIEKIAADAEAEVAKIAAAAKEDVSSIERETAAILETLRAEAEAVLSKKRGQQELVATSKAKQEGKLKVQQAKRTGLDAIFTAVYEQLLAQDSGAYVVFFTAHAKRILPADIKAKQVRAPESRLVETAKILQDLGLESSVEADPTLNAGLVVQAEDGVYDVSFDRIFALKRPELEMEIVNQFLN